MCFVAKLEKNKKGIEEIEQKLTPAEIICSILIEFEFDVSMERVSTASWKSVHGFVAIAEQNKKGLNEMDKDT